MFFILLYVISKTETDLASEIANSKSETQNYAPRLLLLKTKKIDLQAISKIKTQLVPEIVFSKIKTQLHLEIAISKYETNWLLRLIILKVNTFGPRDCYFY